MYEEAQPFFAGLKERALRLQRCQSCGKIIFYPRAYCPDDLGELVYEDVETTGSIITYTVVERCSEPSLQDKLPYIAALIQLDAGPNLFGRVVNVNLPLEKKLFEERVKGGFEIQGTEEMLVFELD